MRYWIGVTDNVWYRYLAGLRPDEVNFWRPSGKPFSTIEVGAPFLFKLHSPENYIVGGGFLVRAETLPLSLAWEAFGKKNGAETLEELVKLIQGHRGDAHPDPQVGCIILNQPFFIPREHWVPQPEERRTFSPTDTPRARRSSPMGWRCASSITRLSTATCWGSAPI